MTDEKNVGTDILGLRPVGEAIKIGTQAAVDATSALLSRLILPAAEEVGLYFRDRVAAFRTRNLVSVTARAEVLFEEQGVSAVEVQVHPRLGISIIDQSSWAEDEIVQGMWAGLLVSSAAERPDDENLMFVSLLSQMTAVQARILTYACQNAPKDCDRFGLVAPVDELTVTLEQLLELAGINDVPRLDREMDHLRGLELLTTGFPALNAESAEPPKANLTPTALGLQMVARCSGSRDPVQFYGLKRPDTLDTGTGEE